MRCSLRTIICTKKAPQTEPPICDDVFWVESFISFLYGWLRWWYWWGCQYLEAGPSPQQQHQLKAAPQQKSDLCCGNFLSLPTLLLNLQGDLQYKAHSKVWHWPKGDLVGGLGVGTEIVWLSWVELGWDLLEVAFCCCSLCLETFFFFCDSQIWGTCFYTQLGKHTGIQYWSIKVSIKVLKIYPSSILRNITWAFFYFAASSSPSSDQLASQTCSTYKQTKTGPKLNPTKAQSNLLESRKISQILETQLDFRENWPYTQVSFERASHKSDKSD